MAKSDGHAEDIAEDLLYRTGLAHTTGDMKAAAECFELPQLMETSSGRMLIETEDEVIRVFKNVRRYLAENDVSDIVRTVVSAEFLDPNLIGSTHVSRLMKSDGTLFRAPYPTYSILRRTGGEWRIVSSTYAILDAPEHNSALSPHVSELDQPE